MVVFGRAQIPQQDSFSQSLGQEAGCDVVQDLWRPACTVETDLEYLSRKAEESCRMRYLSDSNEKNNRGRMAAVRHKEEE